jgi:hypothetical protein
LPAAKSGVPSSFSSAGHGERQISQSFLSAISLKQTARLCRTNGRFWPSVIVTTQPNALNMGAPIGLFGSYKSPESSIFISCN